jgi:hypothetical protein
VVASTPDLIVHLWVAGRELAEADLALPPKSTADAAAGPAGADAATAAGADAAAAAAGPGVGTAGLSRPHVGRLLDTIASKLVARLVKEANDLPSALEQLKRELPSKLDRVQVPASL